MKAAKLNEISNLAKKLVDYEFSVIELEQEDLDNATEDEIQDILANRISDETSWLINSFKYEQNGTKFIVYDIDYDIDFNDLIDMGF